MFQFLNTVFSPHFMPHGMCYLWRPGLVALQVITNSAIGLAYVAITATLFYLVRHVRALPFHWIYVAFGVFIVTCGITHFFDVLVIWYPIYWVDGAVRAATAIASVTTAILLPPLIPRVAALAGAAEQSRERQVKLGEAYREIAAQLDKTREIETFRTDFFANVSHELRTPLALILGPAEELLYAANLDSQQLRDVAVIERNARILLNLVNELLDMSKLEAGQMRLEYAQADIGALIALTCANFDAIAEQRNTTYMVDVPTGLMGQVDPVKLQRIVLNLVGNAFKFTPAGGSIRVGARRDERGWLRMEVADNGPGVQPEYRELIFERFRQIDEGANRRFGGTGLGLAIARDLAQLHRGSLYVESNPEGSGALFVTEIPLTAPQGEPVAAHPAAPVIDDGAAAALAVDPPLKPAAAAHGADIPQVLVVEDNVEMNRFLRDALSADYRVAVAFDGHEGVAKAVELTPDIIISDVMMPGLSGEQLLTRIRAHEPLRQVPVLLLTAKAGDDTRVRLLREGAQDYVMKPFSLAELRARVANLVTVKRVRDVLQAELDDRTVNLETLAREVALRKRELATAFEAMRVARTQAEQASQFKSNFLSLISHELRTPLNVLQLQLERMGRDRRSLDQARQAVLDRMHLSLTRLAGLIDSLLEYSRVERGQLVNTVKLFDLNQAAAEVVEEYRPYAESKALTIEFHPQPDLAPLSSDPRLAGLIISNLISNAVKFTDRGQVEVSVGVGDGGQYRIAVKDSGRGIAPQDHARIFEPFQHLEPVAHKHTPGVGLGLALVREMVRALGGRIYLESRLESGSTFVVTLPVIVASSSPAGAQ